MKRYLYAFYGVMVLLFAAMLLAASGSLLFLVGLVTTVVLAGATAMMLLAIVRSEGVFDHGDPRTNLDVDVSGEGRRPPDALHEPGEILAGWGFRRLGESATVTAEGKELGVEWTFVSADERVIAAMVPSPTARSGVLAGFTTIFPDYTWAITMFPVVNRLEETINGPGLYLHHVDEDLPATYQHHRELVQALTGAHGQPRTFATLDAYLHTAPVFRERYVMRMLSRGQQISWLQPVVAVSITLLTGIVTIAARGAPEVGLSLIVVFVSILVFFLSSLLPVQPGIATRLRWLVVLMLGLIPLIFVVPEIAVVHLLGLTVIINRQSRYIVPSAKALSDEIMAGDKDAARARQSGRARDD